MYGYSGGAIVVVLGPPMQIIVPDTTLAAGGWLDQASSATNLHGPVADSDAATYIQSPANPITALVKLGLGPINTPAAGDITILIDVEQV